MTPVNSAGVAIGPGTDFYRPAPEAWPVAACLFNFPVRERCLFSWLWFARCGAHILRPLPSLPAGLDNQLKLGV